MPSADASRLSSPFGFVVHGLGPAAAKDSALRLRGGDAGKGASKHAPSNGAKAPSYKAAAAAGGVELTTGDKESPPATSGTTDTEDDADNTIVLQVDELKLEALRKLGASLRIGGRGTARRKFKAVRKKRGKMDDVKFQNALKKVGLNPVGDIEKVTVYKEDGTVWTYTNPRVLANQQANQFCIQGKYDEKKPPVATPEQVKAKEFDALSDIDKLRQIAQADLPAAAVAAGAGAVAAADHEGVEGVEAKCPEDVLAAEEKGGNGEEKMEAVDEAATADVDDAAA